MSTPYETPASPLEGGGMAPCIGCAKELHSTASTCPHCGASQRSGRYKSKTTAALFAFFLGGFGGHRFYLGQWWGIFYLMFFWVWIPGLIAFIEFIVFLASDGRRWDDKYNEGRPAGPNERTSGPVIAILIILGGFFAIAVIGILAAVALPAYQDYTVRAKVSQVLIQVEPIKVGYQEFYSDNNLLPDSNIMMGLDEPYYVGNNNEIDISENGIEIRFSDNDTENKLLNSKTLLLDVSVSGERVTWDCKGGTLESKYRPANCR